MLTIITSTNLSFHNVKHCESIIIEHFREKKVDWKKVSWEGGLTPTECKRYWNYVQDRIRRFRIMAELIPDAKHWIGKCTL